MAKSEQELLKELFPQAYGAAAAAAKPKASSEEKTANEQLKGGMGPVKVNGAPSAKTPIANAITPNFGGAAKFAPVQKAAKNIEAGLQNAKNETGGYRVKISDFVPSSDSSVSLIPKARTGAGLNLNAPSVKKITPARAKSYKRTPTVSSVAETGTNIGRFKILSEREYESGGYSRGTGDYAKYVREALGHIKNTGNKSEIDGANKYLKEIKLDEQGVKSVPLTKFGLMTEHEYKARGGKDYDRYTADETSKLISQKEAALKEAEKKTTSSGNFQNAAGAVKEAKEKNIKELTSDLDILKSERNKTKAYQTDEEERKYAKWKADSLGEYVKSKTDGFSPSDPQSVADYVAGKIRNEFNSYPKRSVSGDINGKYDYTKYQPESAAEEDKKSAEDVKYAARFISENPQILTGGANDERSRAVSEYFGGLSKYYDFLERSIDEFSDTQKALGGKEFYEDKKYRKKATDILTGKKNINGEDFGLMSRAEYNEKFPQTAEEASDYGYLEYVYDGISANLSEMKEKALTMTYAGMKEKYGDWYDANLEAANEIAAALDMQYKIKNASGKSGVLSRGEWNKLGKKINASYEDYLADEGTDETTARYTNALYQKIKPTAEMESEDTELRKKINTSRIIVDSYDREKKYLGKNFGDNEVGQFRANYALGALGIESNKLWYRYYQTGDRAALQAAKSADSVTDEFSKKNRTVIEDENKRFKWITKSLAQHIPQEIDQASYGAAPAAVGAMLGVFVGHPFMGARIGMSVGSVGEGYVQMTGDAMRSMTNAGLDFDEAKELAANEGFINSVIESGGELLDIGVDFALAGVGMGDFFSGKISDLGERGLMKIGVSGKTAKHAVEAAKKGGAMVVGAVGEGAEEVEQSMVSKTNERIAKNIAAGKYERGDMLYLLGETSNLSLYSDDDWKEMFGNDGWEGFKVGLMMSAIHGGTIRAANSVTNLLTKNTTAKIGSSLKENGMEAPVIVNALAYGDASTRDMVTEYSKITSDDTENINSRVKKSEKLLAEIFKATNETVAREAQISEKQLKSAQSLTERIKTAAKGVINGESEISETDVEANVAANRVIEGRGFENDLETALANEKARRRLSEKFGLENTSETSPDAFSAAVAEASKAQAQKDISDSMKRARVENHESVAAVINNLSRSGGEMRSYAREVIESDKNLKSLVKFKEKAASENISNTDLAVLSGNKNYIDEQYVRDFADMWAKSAEKTGAWVFEKSDKNVKEFADTLANYVLGKENLREGAFKRIADGMKTAIAEHAAYLAEKTDDIFLTAQAESLKRSVPLALATVSVGAERGALVNNNLNNYVGGIYYDRGRNYGNRDNTAGSSDYGTDIHGRESQEYERGRTDRGSEERVRRSAQRDYAEGERKSFTDAAGRQVSYIEVTATDENSLAVAEYTNRFGYECRFVKGLNVDGYRLNGMRKGGTIYLDIENESLEQTQGHEILHAIKSKIGSRYTALSDKVISFVGNEKFEILKSRYADNYFELYSKESYNDLDTRERANVENIITEEIMADIVGFVRAGDNESLSAIFGYSEKNVSEINDMVNNILDEGMGKAETERNNGNADNNELKYSIAKDFSKRFDDWLNSGKPDRKTLFVGMTSKALQSIGVKEERVLWDTSKINKTLNKHRDMTAAVLKQVPEILENPILIMDSKSHLSRLTLFGEVRDLSGKPVLAVLELEPSNSYNGLRLDAIKIASTYGKNNVQSLIDNSNIKYIDSNKNRVQNWLTGNRLQLPFAVNQSNPVGGAKAPSFDNTIPQNGGVVNSIIRKNSENDTKNSKKSENNVKFQIKDEQTGEGGNNYGYEDDFRRIQAASERLSDEDIRLFHRGDRRVDEGIRNGFSRVFGRRLEAERSKLRYDTQLLKNVKTNKNITVLSGVAGNTFHDIFEIIQKYLEFGDAVDVHSVEDYNNTKNYLTSDGLSGFSITPEGDLISVFSLRSQGFLRTISEYVKAEGAKTLDCYQSKIQPLADIYEKAFGFKTASLLDFNYDVIAEDRGEAYANHFIKTYGAPPVAFMVNTDETVAPREFNKNQYDEALSYRDSFVDKTQDSIKFQIKDGEKITEKDIEAVRSIGRKSVNDFTSEDIRKTEGFARKYFSEMGVKSPFFRAWFGDWRENDTTPIKTIPVETIDLQDVVMQNGDYHINDTGWDVYAGKTLREETKHYSRGEKVSVKALAAVEDILNNAVLLDTEVSEPSSNNKTKGTAFMHKLYAPISYDGENYIAKISVEEYLSPSDEIKRKAYHLQSIKIEAADGHAADKTSASMSRSDTASINSISDLFEYVKQNDKNFSPKEASKVVNNDGTPKVVYHGSPNEFTVFDKRKAKYSGTFGKAFYFSESDAHAGTYGNLYKVYLDIKNPIDGNVNINTLQLKKFLRAVADNEDYSIENYGTYDIDEIYENLNKSNLFAALRDINTTAIGDFAEAVGLYNSINGTNYDGIISDTETVVFNPNQIKSAADNIGTFDGANDDIRFQLKTPAEETKNLVALHNISEEKLNGALELGGFPMPSIAVTKSDLGHEGFGDITVLFGKETIDPNASNDNKLFGGDAYTPMFPTVEYEADKIVTDKLYAKYSDIRASYGDDAAHGLYKYAENTDDVLNSEKGEQGIIKAAKNDTALMRTFLYDVGVGEIKTVEKTTTEKLSEAKAEQYDYLIDKLGKEAFEELTKRQPGTSPFAAKKAWAEKYMARFDEAFTDYFSETFGFSKEETSNILKAQTTASKTDMAREILRYIRNGKETTVTEPDYAATNEIIKKTAREKGFDSWVDGLFGGIEKTKGIRNGKDPFAPSGSRRSFSQLHEKFTLDNVVKQMRSELQKGQGSIFTGTSQLKGAATKEYGSISEMKADSGRLSNENIDIDNYSDEWYGIASGIVGDSGDSITHMNRVEDLTETVVEAANKTKTAKSFKQKLMSDNFYNITEETADKIYGFLNRLSEIPVKYFEAKPQRAVGFDEIKAVFVPDNANAELVKRLESSGMKTISYKHDDKSDRTRRINEFADGEDIKFQRAHAAKTSELFRKLTDSIPSIADDEIVYSATGNEFEVGEKKLSRQVYEYFDSLGGVVHRKNFGDVIINDKGVDSSIAHGIGRAKAIAFASVPAVIEKGRQIDYEKNWKGRNYDTYVFAAPIQIENQKAFVGVVVTKSDIDNRYYLHEVSDTDGNIITIKKDDVSFKSKSETAKSSPLGETSSTDIISRKTEDVNENTEVSDKSDVRFQRKGRAASYDPRTAEEKEIAKLTREVKSLKRKNEYLTAETKVSKDGTRTVEAKWLKPITDELLETTCTEMTKRALAGALRAAYEKILNKPKGEPLTESDVKPFYDLALEIMENTYTEGAERFKTFVDSLNGDIDPRHAADVLGETGAEAVREAMRRGMKVKKGVGSAFDDGLAMEELRGLYPEFVTEEDLNMPWQSFAEKVANYKKNRNEILRTKYSYANDGVSYTETGMRAADFRLALARTMLDYAQKQGIEQHKTLADRLSEAKAQLKEQEKAHKADMDFAVKAFNEVNAQREKIEAESAAKLEKAEIRKNSEQLKEVFRETKPVITKGFSHAIETMLGNGDKNIDNYISGIGVDVLGEDGKWHRKIFSGVEEYNRAMETVPYFERRQAKPIVNYPSLKAGISKVIGENITNALYNYAEDKAKLKTPPEIYGSDGVSLKEDIKAAVSKVADELGGIASKTLENKTAVIGAIVRDIDELAKAVGVSEKSYGGIQKLCMKAYRDSFSTEALSRDKKDRQAAYTMMKRLESAVIRGKLKRTPNKGYYSPLYTIEDMLKSADDETRALAERAKALLDANISTKAKDFSPMSAINSREMRRETGRSFNNYKEFVSWITNEIEADENKVFSNSLVERAKRISKYYVGADSVNSLSMNQVNEILETVPAFLKQLRDQNEFLNAANFKSVNDSAKETVKNMPNLKTKTAFGDFAQKARRRSWWDWNVVFNRLGRGDKNSPIYRLAYNLTRANTYGVNSYSMQAYELIKDFTDDYKYMQKLEEEVNIGEFIDRSDIEGERKTDIKLTRGLLISLYMHNRRNELVRENIDTGAGGSITPAMLNANQRHIMFGGLVIPDIKRYYDGRTGAAFGDYKQGRITLDPGQIKEITDKYLTEKDKKYADACAAYFEFAKSETNRVSSELEGMNIAKVDEYFPIVSDKDFVNPSGYENVFSQSNSESSSVLNPSTHKMRVEGASNPIMLMDISNVMKSAISADARYVAEAIPLSDFNKLLSRNIYTENGMTSVREQIRNRAGDWYIKWMRKWIDGISGNEKPLPKIAQKYMSNFAAAKLTGNWKVGLGQRMAYSAIMAELGVAAAERARRHIKGPWNNKEIDALISKYSPVMWSRGRGYSSTDIADASKNPIFRKLGKIADTTTRNDLALMRRIWFACYEWGKDMQKGRVEGFDGVKIDTDEFYRLVARKFEDVVLFTQNSFEYSQRAGILWRDNPLLSWLAMFRSDKMKYFSMTQSAFDTFLFRRAEYKRLKEAGAATEKISAAAREASVALKKLVGTEAAIGTANFKYLLVSKFLYSLYSPSSRDDEPYRDENGNITVWSVLKRLGGEILLDRIGQAGAVWNFLTDIVEADDLVALWGALNGDENAKKELTDSLKDKDVLFIPAADALNSILSAATAIIDSVDLVENGDRHNAALNMWTSAKTVIEYLTGLPVGVAERYIRDGLYYAVLPFKGKEAAQTAVKELFNKTYTVKDGKAELTEYTARDLYSTFKQGNMKKFGGMYDSLVGGMLFDGVDDPSAVNKKLYSLYVSDVNKGAANLDKAYDGKWTRKISWRDGEYIKTEYASTAADLEAVRKKIMTLYGYDIMDKIKGGSSEVPEGVEIGSPAVSHSEMNKALLKIGAISEDEAAEGASGKDYGKLILDNLLNDKFKAAADIWNAANEFNADIAVGTDKDKAEVMTNKVESEYKTRIKEKLLAGDKSVDGKFCVTVKWSDESSGKVYEAKVTTVDDYFNYKRTLEKSGYKWEDIAGDVYANTDDIDNRLNKIGVADPVIHYGSSWYMSAYYQNDPAALNTYYKNARSADKYEDWDSVKEDMYSAFRTDAQKFCDADMADEVNSRIESFDITVYGNGGGKGKKTSYNNWNDYKYAVSQLEAEGYRKDSKKKPMTYKVWTNYNYDSVDSFVDSAKTAGSYGSDWADKEKKVYLNYVGNDVINHQTVSYETAYASPQSESSAANSSNTTVGNNLPTEGTPSNGESITYKSSSYTEGSGKSGGRKRKVSGNGGKAPLKTNAQSLSARSLIPGKSYDEGSAERTVSILNKKEKAAKTDYKKLISKLSGAHRTSNASTYREIMRNWFGR